VNKLQMQQIHNFFGQGKSAEEIAPMFDLDVLTVITIRGKED